MLKGGKEAAYGLNSEKISYTYVTTFPIQNLFPLQFTVFKFL